MRKKIVLLGGDNAPKGKKEEPTNAVDSSTEKIQTSAKQAVVSTRKSGTDRLLDSLEDLIAKEDTEVPGKLYKLVIGAFTAGTTQRTDLFLKLSSFCKKHYKLFESLVKGKGHITDKAFKNYEVYMEEPHEDSDGLDITIPDTVFVDYVDGGDFLELTKDGIKYAANTEFDSNGSAFVYDERDLGNYLRAIKGILTYFSKEDKKAYEALIELHKIVKTAISAKTSKEEKK